MDSATAPRRPADPPRTLTDGERTAYRMGVEHGLGLASDALKPGDRRAARALENLRIAIAARSVECEAPAHWPVRGA